LPRWTKLVQEHRGALSGLTPATLPDVLRDPAAFARRLNDPGKDTPSRDDLRRWAMQTLATALTVALLNAGWELHAPPGEDVFCTQGSLRITPFTVVKTLASGALAPEVWREQCEAAGISALLLAPAGNPPGPVAAAHASKAPAVLRK